MRLFHPFNLCLTATSKSIKYYSMQLTHSYGTTDHSSSRPNLTTRKKKSKLNLNLIKAFLRYDKFEIVSSMGVSGIETFLGQKKSYK